jgi:hypothetical protein
LSTHNKEYLNNISAFVVHCLPTQGKTLTDT